MAVSTFEINLEHDIDEQYQYEPGEILRGHVSLQLKEAIKVKAIQVQIKGEATVSWEDENVKNPQSVRADETYVDITQNLVALVGNESQNLQAGKHRFPMEYTLPMNLPSSFIGKYGSITYVAKATLKEDKKFGMNTLITSEPFLVLRRLNLEGNDDLSIKVAEIAEKRLWGALAFCISGKVTLDVSINKKGHLPGEDIYMDAEIVNDSPRVVRAIQAAIIMHSSFHAKNSNIENTQVVNKKRDEWEMMMGDGRRWKGVRLTIPPYIPESRLDGCDIIDIRYELIFRLEISGNHELKIVIPLTIGTSQGSDPSRLPANGMTAEEEKNDPNGNLTGIDPEIMNQEEAEAFRYPMQPGETRSNPMFGQLSTESPPAPKSPMRDDDEPPPLMSSAPAPPPPPPPPGPSPNRE